MFKLFKHGASATLFFAQVAALLTLQPTTSLAADMIKGQNLYQIHCSGCHGEKGMSVNPEAPNFARGERLFQSDAALIEVVRNGKNSMPAFLGLLQDREIFDVISYARTLQW